MNRLDDGDGVLTTEQHGVAEVAGILAAGVLRPTLLAPRAAGGFTAGSRLGKPSKFRPELP